MANSRQIEQAAAAWLARRDAGAWSADEQRELEAWLNAATAHRVAFLRLDAAWQQSDRLKALGAGIPTGVLPQRHSWGHSLAAAPPIDAMEDRETAVPIRFEPPSSAKAPPRSRRRYMVCVAGLVVIAALVSASIGWQHYAQLEQATFRTAIGGLQEIPLSDGSMVTLSSDSQMDIRFSHGERRVELHKGEAFFDVAKDRHRPFVVAAGNRRVIAVGTHYDVRRDAGDLRVVVTEGVVRLESDGASLHRQPTTLLPAGSVATATDAGIVVHTGSVQQAEEYLSWRSGFIRLHDTPLAVAAAEFNRYNTRKIIINDATIGRMRVGGNFRWSNVESFVGLLEQGFPVRAVHDDDSIVLKRR